MCLWLHGRGDNASNVMDDLRLPNFLAQSIGTGTEPFAVVSTDGGSTYWHNRANGDGAESMLIDELPDVLRGAGLTIARWAVDGWSMGGYGAAERHDWFRAVAASSPAVWFHAQDTRPGAFDDAQDWARHDVLASLAKLPARVRIDCGSDDPFASTSAAMLKGIPNVEGRIGAGAHVMRFWRAVLPAQLAFLGRSLAAPT